MIKRVHKVAGLVLAAVVVLSGCSSKEPKEAKSSSKPKPTATTNSGSATGTPSSQDTSGKVDPIITGSWGAFPKPGSVIILNINHRQVELRGDGHSCLGKVSREGGVHVIRLKCRDGNTDRTVGRVYGLTKDGMTVDWEGLGADAFRHAKPETG